MLDDPCELLSEWFVVDDPEVSFFAFESFDFLLFVSVVDVLPFTDGLVEVPVFLESDGLAPGTVEPGLVESGLIAPGVLLPGVELGVLEPGTLLPGVVVLPAPGVPGVLGVDCAHTNDAPINVAGMSISPSLFFITNVLL